jgi:hypothetical protein
MSLFSLSLLSLWACGDKPVTTDTASTTSEPASSPTDDPIIEEEIEPLEAVAIGFEYIGTWDQNNASLGGWTFDSGEAADAYMMVHITNMDFFSSGAGDDNENICTLIATFINQPAVLDAQEYPWDNPPSNSSQYPLDGTSAATWGGFEGYLTFLGFSNDTSDTCSRLEDERIYTVTDEGYADITIEGMHFGLSYGALTAEHESRLSESYENSDIGTYFEDNKGAFVSQYIHMNHTDVNAADGFDFTGYDWNYARLAAVNTDGTIGTVPCDWDDTLDCYDLVEYDGTKNVFSASDAFWYEDFPNLDFDLLTLGVPEISVDPVEETAAEAFCSLFSDTCGEWDDAMGCEEWYNAAETGTEGDSTGASQSCYDYHLSVAVTDTEADPSNGVFSMHCDHASGAAPCVEEEPTAAEAFCSLFTDTCGEWGAMTGCEDWYNAADAGTDGDTTGASQACYDYHLSVAATDTDADPSNGVFSMHCDHASGDAPCNNE